jgi:CelD/BcsL family acetyltransferase involved in cellulose biosynthesis
MLVQIIDSLDALQACRDDWDALYAADPGAHVFLSWSWVAAWFARLDCQWLVLVAKARPDAPQICGVLPLQLYTLRGDDGRLHNELCLAGWGGVAGYAGFLCDPAHEEEAVRAFSGAARRLNWSKLHLHNLHLPPRRRRLFLGAFPPSRFEAGRVQRPDDGDGIDHDVYVYVDLPDDWDRFLAERMGHSTRQNARRTLRRIDDDEAFRVTHVTAETLEGDLEILLRFWEAQGAAKRAARYNPRLPRAMMGNFRSMLRASFHAGQLFLPVLWWGDRPIAAQGKLIDRRNNTLIGLVGGRDLEVRRPPPGLALHLHSLRWAIREGFTTYDMQTGDFAYKYDFGGQEHRVECFEVAPRNPPDRLEPLSLPAALRWAQADHSDGAPDRAEQVCRQILEIDPAHPGALDMLAEVAAARTLPAPVFDLGSQLKVAGGLSLEEQIRRAIRKP